jgi:hypothetical protein
MTLSIYVLAFVFHSAAYGVWTPPANPDPDKILDEAQDDRQAGRYADALAKHVWFHENALKYQPALYGVRLSFALGYWVDLGKAYPPALEKLKTIRDEAAKKVRKADREPKAFEIFHDFAAINEELKEEAKTTELFVWLDAHKPQAAERAFGVAEPALIQSKQYRLCGKYINPDRSFAEIVRLYQLDKQMSKNPKFGEHLREHSERTFSNSTATLVALLVLNDRKTDALRIAEKALKEFDDAEFKQALEKAKKGELPPAWP